MRASVARQTNRDGSLRGSLFGGLVVHGEDTGVAFLPGIYLVRTVSMGIRFCVRIGSFFEKKESAKTEYMYDSGTIAMLVWNSMTTESDDESAHGDDLKVVAMIASGDKGALAQLYDRYASVLTGLGMKILKDKGEVESLLHDVFVDVWQNAGSYDPDRGTVKTWLCLRMRSHGLERSRVAGSELADFLTPKQSAGSSR